jgi:hypothetical protein
VADGFRDSGQHGRVSAVKIHQRVNLGRDGMFGSQARDACDRAKEVERDCDVRRAIYREFADPGTFLAGWLK